MNTTDARQKWAVLIDEHKAHDGSVDSFELADSIIEALATTPQADGATVDAFERALVELVNKIDTGLDSGDLLVDAKRASVAIDSILSGGDLVACAHEYFRDSGERYENSIEFRIGWNACLDAIGVARSALAATHAPAMAETQTDAAREALAQIAQELRNYNPSADEYKGEHIHKVWARGIEAALTAGATAQERNPVAWIEPCELDDEIFEGSGVTTATLYKARGEYLTVPLYAGPVPSAIEETQFDMLAHLQRQRDFSERTFGPGARTKGVVDHIRKELVEVEQNPGDFSEWADVVILALDGFWRAGATPQQIIDTIVSKQTKNEGRTWPDWRTADPNKAIEHDRTGEPYPQCHGKGTMTFHDPEEAWEVPCGICNSDRAAASGGEQGS